eukprot:11643376-Alexandrium_andersonii.AAC.1
MSLLQCLQRELVRHEEHQPGQPGVGRRYAGGRGGGVQGLRDMDGAQPGRPPTLGPLACLRQAFLWLARESSDRR